jgi:hypothetical protein
MIRSKITGSRHSLILNYDDQLVDRKDDLMQLGAAMVLEPIVQLYSTGTRKNRYSVESKVDTWSHSHSTFS